MLAGKEKGLKKNNLLTGAIGFIMENVYGMKKNHVYTNVKDELWQR